MNTHRDTDASYSDVEAERIRRVILTAGAPVECPRCSGRLAFEGPVRQRDTRIRAIRIRCPTCRRYLCVSGLPT